MTPPLANATPDHTTEPWRNNLRHELDVELAGPRPAWWWTGRPPPDCPGLQSDGTLTSLSLPNLATCDRQQVLDYFDNTWTLTEVLFSGLKGEEAFFRPPYHHLRHPMIFYYGHPPALYINKLRVAGLIEKPLNPYFEQLFETGVDEMRWDDLSKNAMLWPRLQEVHAYRQQVYRTVREVIETHPGLAPGHPPIQQNHPLWALFMGFEHERIHLETSSVLIRELPLTLVQRPAEWPRLHPTAERTAAGFPPRVGHDSPANDLIDAAVSNGRGFRVVARSRRAAGDPRTCPEISVHRNPRHLVAAGWQRVSASPALRVVVTGITPPASGNAHETGRNQACGKNHGRADSPGSPCWP